MLEVNVQSTLDKLVINFTEIKDNLGVEDILDEAAALLLNRIRQRFLEEKDPDGNPWIPSQAAIERRKEGGTGTLFDTGNLWRSIQLGDKRPLERIIGTFSDKDVSYGKYHQFGVPGRLPIRRFLGFGKSDEDLVNELLQQRLERLLKA